LTGVNPEEIELLFERFISAKRGEPLDIDIDFRA
jgi:error-prone DNA polymerase